MTTPPLLDGPVPLEESLVLDVLSHGELKAQARLPDASNATILAEVEHGPIRLRCVYKPVAGEQPLWDFPDGTLGNREVAAYEVSAATGWDLVPPTAWRADGPFGPGMCQLWIATAQDSFLDTPAGGVAGNTSADRPVVEAPEALVDVVAPDAVPEGWRKVLRAQDGLGNPVALVHANHPDLRRMALLDVVLNNADRKGGHVLVGRDGAVRGIDHGVTFHSEHKLRTVLWGWADEPIAPDELSDLRALRGLIDGALGARLSNLLSPEEVAATRRRVDLMIDTATFPQPTPGHPPIPWPAF